MRSHAYVETQTSMSGGDGSNSELQCPEDDGSTSRLLCRPHGQFELPLPNGTPRTIVSFASRSLARAIRIKYKIYLPARETPPPRCWLDTEIDSRVTMESIPVPNQQIGGRLPGAHPVYTRVRVSGFTSREYLWRNGRFNSYQRAYYGESAY